MDLALTVEGEVNAMSEVDRIYFVDCVATERAKMKAKMKGEEEERAAMVAEEERVPGKEAEETFLKEGEAGNGSRRGRRSERGERGKRGERGTHTAAGLAATAAGLAASRRLRRHIPPVVYQLRGADGDTGQELPFSVAASVGQGDLVRLSIDAPIAVNGTDKSTSNGGPVSTSVSSSPESWYLVGRVDTFREMVRISESPLIESSSDDANVSIQLGITRTNQGSGGGGGGGGGGTLPLPPLRPDDDGDGNDEDSEDSADGDDGDGGGGGGGYGAAAYGGYGGRGGGGGSRLEADARREARREARRAEKRVMRDVRWRWVPMVLLEGASVKSRRENATVRI